MEQKLINGCYILMQKDKLNGIWYRYILFRIIIYLFILSKQVSIQ